MITTYEFVKKIIMNNPQVHSLYFREYSYPAQPVGTEPASKDKIYPVERNDFLNGSKFEILKSKLRKNRNIGIESKVITPQGSFHIPMMDFSLNKSTESRNMIKTLWKKGMLKHNGKGGVFETDNSYHFIGNEKLLTENDYFDFLGWCLLMVYKDKKMMLKNIVDVPFVAYCILKKSGCLRITKYPNSKIIPSLIFSI